MGTKPKNKRKGDIMARIIFFLVKWFCVNVLQEKIMPGLKFG